jgi:hypothetical protein
MITGMLNSKQVVTHTGWIIADTTREPNSQIPMEIQPRPIPPRCSFQFPRRISKKKNRIAPANPPKNVVSGRHRKAGRRMSIERTVPMAQNNASFLEDSKVGAIENRLDD